MNNSIFSFLLVFVSLILNGQEPLHPPLNSTEKATWKYDGFSYADFGTGEEHSYFSLLYKMNPKLHMELQGFYDTYRTANVFDFSYRVKWYPSKKLYLFSGAGVQIEQSKFGQSKPNLYPRIFTGVGYEATEQITIEAVYDYNFNGVSQNSATGPFTLKSKYRF